jgi:hypothetical protein
LDTIIRGDISDILAYKGDFAMLRDFNHPDEGASGVMAWTPSKKTEEIWNRWEKSEKPQFNPKGDGGWVHQMMPDCDKLQDLFPGAFVSFKKDCLKGVPRHAKVICFHGLPRPHTLKGIMNYW